MSMENSVALKALAEKAGMSVEELMADLKAGGLKVTEKPAAQFAMERAAIHKDICDVLDSYNDEFVKKVLEDENGNVIRKRFTLSADWAGRTFNMADGNTTSKVDIIVIVGGANYGKNDKKKEE